MPTPGFKLPLVSYAALPADREVKPPDFDFVHKK
jgi:hypothetical protein